MRREAGFTGEIVQSIKSLLCKHGNLSLDPQNLNEEPGTAVGTYNPSAGEVESEQSWGLLAT